MRAWIAAALAAPDAAYVALLAGLLLVYGELVRPGSVVPGALGGAVSLVALHALSRHPWRPSGVALLILSVVLFLALLRRPTPAWSLLAPAACWVLGSALWLEGEARMRLATLLLAAAPFAILTSALVRLAQLAWAAKLAT